jgi:hypothetical protein
LNRTDHSWRECREWSVRFFLPTWRASLAWALMTVVALVVSTLLADAPGLDLDTWESKTPRKPELPTALKPRQHSGLPDILYQRNN